MRKHFLISFTLLFISILLIAFIQASSSEDINEEHFSLNVQTQMVKDLNKWDDIKNLEQLRVLVSPNRSNFFIAKDQARGFEYEMFEQLEKDLQKSLNKKNFQVIYVPVAHNKLMSSLMQGYGDVAAAMLTITPERQKIVDFSTPYLTGVSEVLIRHKSAPPINSIKELSGKNIYVADGSSYLSSLTKLNREFELEGLAPMSIKTFKELNTGDVIELLNTALFDYTFADHTLAELWSEVLPNIIINNKIIIGNQKEMAWAIRKDSPQLKEILSNFANKNRKGSLLGNIFFMRYYQKPYWLDNDLLNGLGKVNDYKAFFIEAGKAYNFDPIFLAMQAFQESSFDPNAKSSAGALGIMQLLPSTAKDMGVKDIYDPKQNIMGGAKYMDWIRSHYFKDIQDKNKIYFCLAAYNAGFRRVQNWRKEAPLLGYDPNIWFGHVEHIALQKTGLEPVQYVAKISKAYTAISQYLKIVEEKEKIIQAAKDSSSN